MTKKNKIFDEFFQSPEAKLESNETRVQRYAGAMPKLKINSTSTSSKPVWRQFKKVYFKNTPAYFHVIQLFFNEYFL